MPALNLPQPDFHTLGGHLQGMAIEVDRCKNLPAVQTTNVILDVVTQLSNNVRELTTSVAQLGREMQTMRTDMQTMRTDMQTMRTGMQTMRKEMEAIGTELRGEMQTMRTELREEMEAMGTELRGEMQTMRTELREEMEAMGTELRGEMQAMRTELRGEMEAMGRSLERRMDVIDYNNQARVFNSKTVTARPDSVIRPLKNVETHEVVKLPKTIRDLDSSLTNTVGDYLEALGQEPKGNAAEKKAQLKECLGLY